MVRTSPFWKESSFGSFGFAFYVKKKKIIIIIKEVISLFNMDAMPKTW